MLTISACHPSWYPHVTMTLHAGQRTRIFLTTCTHKVSVPKYHKVSVPKYKNIISHRPWRVGYTFLENPLEWLLLTEYSVHKYHSMASNLVPLHLSSLSLMKLYSCMVYQWSSQNLLKRRVMINIGCASYTNFSPYFIWAYMQLNIQVWPLNRPSHLHLSSISPPCGESEQ